MKNLLTLKKDTNKGITLIALIITIIVLLILTGVSIATLTGENGILTQAKNAKKEMTKAEAKERIQLEVLGSYGTDGEIDIATLKANIGKNISEAVIGGETELPLTVTVGDYTFTVKANGVVEEGTPTTGGNEAVVGQIVTGENKPYTKNGTAMIPVGFAIVPGLDDVSEGLVISDVANDTTDAGNQFVWIPVTKENPFERRAGYDNGTSQDISEYGEADSTGVNSLFGQSSSSSTSASQSGSLIGESTETQAEAIAMYASVEANGGFYIGRYEAGKDSNGNVVCKKGANAYNNIGWNNDKANNNIKVETGGAVELARNFAEDNNYNTTKVHSTLCYSVQWDTALNFIDPGYKGYAKDSTKMGWYDDNCKSTNAGNTATNEEHITGKDLIYNSEVTVSGSGETAVKIPAGEPTNMHKNIYDMAGNVWEWTMEAHSTIGRAYRGGDYGSTGSSKPASYRYNYYPSYNFVGFRLALYV